MSVVVVRIRLAGRGSPASPAEERLALLPLWPAPPAASPGCPPPSPLITLTVNPVGGQGREEEEDWGVAAKRRRQSDNRADREQLRREISGLSQLADELHSVSQAGDPDTTSLDR